jgi:perosamine synthetase
MSDEIPITRPWLGAQEARGVTDALESRWIGQGPRVAEFEQRFAARVGANHAVALSSGTTALHLALVAAGFGPGDEVIVPALSFIATANAVRMVGARVVFADVDLATLNLDPDDAAGRITGRTRGLMAVHQLGLPADLARLGDLAQKHDLTLLEDAACGLGSSWQNTPIGRPHGTMACFSFHPRKIITTGEGGAITTSDEDLANRLRRLRNHGGEVTPVAGTPGPIQYPELGYNYRMSDLHAAVGLAQLERLDEILKRRRRIARRYDARLRSHPALTTPPVVPDATHNYQSYHVTLSEDVPTTTAEIVNRLATQSISVQGGLTAIHREPAYADESTPTLPHTEALHRRGLFLPIYPELSDDEIARVCDALIAALEGDHGT